MKLKFKNQQFQTDAAKAVTDVFQGQKSADMLEFTHDLGTDNGGFFDSVGYRNQPIEVPYSQVLDNIRNLQMAAQLKPTESFDRSDLRLTIEMETGTGKTYTYIKTMFELNKLYGWSKFIIVVPSIAIREGVCKSFEVMSEHFAAEYGKRIQSFVYDSSQLTKIDQFASDANMHVMIINTQAFAARGEDARRIYMKLDAFRSRRPIDVIAATNPILIIDEPQSVLGADKKNATRNRLKEFNPLFTLLYSATHRADDIVNMIYRLDAMDAYNKKLVKKISVVGIEQKGSTATNGYLYLESIELSEGNPRAVIGFDKRVGNGVKQVTQIVSDRFDIYQNSGELQEYADNYRITEIDGYNRCVHLQNGITLNEGDVIGAVNQLVIRKAQIRATILAHIEKERKLFHQGIKCLSLFFIDHVDNYRKYENGSTQNGEYADIFEEAYADIVGSLQLRFSDDPEYVKYLKSFEPNEVHNGYFSRDKKTGHYVQPKSSELKSESSNDVSAYDLIMKDKERLLSFKEPTRFIFSHSALKEGWDNPNVFQICTLKDSDNQTKKRQEVGRGMRLCVNQQGERQDETVLHGGVFEVNELTVIASESYNTFAAKLQTEIADAVGDRPQKVNMQLFIDFVVTGADGVQKKLSEDDAQELAFTLRMKGYVTKEGQLTPKYHEDKLQGTLDFGDYDEYMPDVVKKLDTVFNPEAVKPENARKIREAKFNEARFERSAFQKLWRKINHQTYYTVDFKTEELINRAVVQLDNHLKVSDIQLRMVTGSLDRIGSKQQLEQGVAMKITDSQTLSVHEEIGQEVRYDLIGKLVENTGLTRKAIVTILKKIRPITFNQFKTNPEEFIIKASNIINECKAIAVIEHVKYHKLDKEFKSDIFSSTTLKGKLGVNALESEKSLYDLVVVDSAGIEMNFAKDLEERNEVAVYTKLPNGFYINTPVGHYNPDWAIVFEEGTDIKHVYFVAETKGSLEESQLRESERSKIECARRHFATIADSSVTYDVVRNYNDLRDIITK